MELLPSGGIVNCLITKVTPSSGGNVELLSFSLVGDPNPDPVVKIKLLSPVPTLKI